jgi:hypothetical protein
MRFQGEEDAVIIEGEVTGRSEGPRFVQPVQARGPIYETDPSAGQGYEQGMGVDLTGLVDQGVSFASRPQSRSIALLVKVPLLAYVALSPKMPAVVRLAALSLGVMEALEVLQRQPEYEEMLPEGY